MSQSKPGLPRQTASHNLRERKTVEKTVIEEEEKPIPPALLLKPAPIRELCNYQAIYKAINTRIKEQDGAIYKISFIVDDVFRGKQPPEGQGKPFIFKFCIAGPSGCGKTEMVNCIQYTLGMESGYEFENQFISIDGSVMQDIQQVNAITGAAPGLVGHDEDKSLAHRLNKAKKLYIGPKLRSILAKKDTKHAEYKRELAEYASGEIEMPPYMFVFIDELDKADPAFMRAINGFLDTGDYCTPDGSEHFKLGKEMHLLIVFTANYGEDMIMQMNSRNQLQAEQYIVHAMKEHGLANNNIGRIGDFFAFFPLKREALKNIIVDKLVNFIQNTAIAKEYGSDRIFYADEVKELLVGKILDLTDRDRGVRHGLRLLFNNLNTLFKKSLDALQKMLQHNNKLLDDDNNRIELKANEFDMQLFNESIEREFKAFEKDIVLALLDDPEFLDKVKERSGTKKNEQELCAYSNNNNSNNQLTVAKNDDSKMGSMSMFIGKNHLASCGLDMNIIINNTTNIFFNSADAARKLREENKELKETLNKIVDIAEEKDKSPDRLIRKIKKATNEVKGLLVDAGEEDEVVEVDEEEPRVRELTEKEYQHEETRKNKEVSLKTNKKNRKHKKTLIKAVVEETDGIKKRRKGDQPEIRENQKKRKVVGTNDSGKAAEEEEKQSSDTENGSSASLATDDDDNNESGSILQKTGRPRKHINGFEYYDKISHNPRYKCTFCHTIIYATRVSLHRCQ